MPENISIHDLKPHEEVSLTLLVVSLKQRRTQQGKYFTEVLGRNQTGTVSLRLTDEALRTQPALSSGLWKITGRVDGIYDRPQLSVSQYQAVGLQQYRDQFSLDPLFPRAFTIDIETLTLPDFRERVGPQLERQLRLGTMRWEQQQRYLDDIAAEEERCYQMGSLNATSGRVLSIAVHVAGLPGADFPALEQQSREYVFGIDADGAEQDEKTALFEFLKLMKDFDPEIDELVGHNIIGFDLPFIFQRCLVHCIASRPFVNLEYSRGVFDTMRQWWLGDRRGRVSLDDIAWALGIESSKTASVEGSKVFDLHQAGRLSEIREYNLNDVRLTRKIYERIVGCFGR